MRRALLARATMPESETEIVVDDPTAPASDSPAVTTTRTVEVVVYAAAARARAAAGLRQLAQRDGMGEGRPAERIPAVLSVRDPRRRVACSASASRSAQRTMAATTFVTRDQLRRVMQVFVPTFLFCLLMQWLGLYVASFLLVAGFMRIIGRIALVEVAAHELPVRAHHVRRRSRSRSTSSCPRVRSKRLFGR